jgi:hypothetical protein
MRSVYVKSNTTSVSSATKGFVNLISREETFRYPGGPMSQTFRRTFAALTGWADKTNLTITHEKGGWIFEKRMDVETQKDFFASGQEGLSPGWRER